LGVSKKQEAPENYFLGKFGSIGLAILFVIHLLLPLRHHLFQGDVAWTEEGHRYSWRMMLRHKTGKGSFTVKGTGGQSEVVRPHTLMNAKFARKMYTHPDMIWQTGQHIKSIYEKKGWKEVGVYANIQCRLNYRKYQNFVDPEIDLGSEPWDFFKSKSWILPEEKEED
ncbi:MAG: HTTM domain-containing protein, partial [Saprospiraceae bacterium]|nr:HTTM domain-containing protein [Saprospiraceae bacterium]